ncbi:hypothetical protein PoB_003245200 [Plakobranchus ocellatus]|uniref:Uncharacterized protein n=1 Tax=Plakobranchus ocellatus TaxID=259542 RepID=A0AAV4AFD4_9GAST|nr:hypothetical protein PoB_003245200 [Plakobranchus ocellatus]
MLICRRTQGSAGFNRLRLFWRGFEFQPVWVWVFGYDQMISGFQALRQTRASWLGLNPSQKSPCRSQGRFPIHCATNAPSETNSVMSGWTPMSEEMPTSKHGFLYIASPQQGDLWLLGPPSGRGASGGARTRYRRVLADLRADSQAIVPPTLIIQHHLFFVFLLIMLLRL